MHGGARLVTLQFTGLSAALLSLAFRTATLMCKLSGVRLTDIRPKWAPAPSYTPCKSLYDYLKCLSSHFPSLNTYIHKILLLPIRNSAMSTDKSV